MSEIPKGEPPAYADTVVLPPHYVKYAVEPIYFLMKNGVPFAEGNVIKYVLRWRDKGGVTDLKKAKRYLEMLINQAEGKEDFAA